MLIPGDLRQRSFAHTVVQQTIARFGRIDTLILNHAVQYPQQSILNISDEQLEQTFRTNILSYYYMAQAALPYMKQGSTIISTASVTAYDGEPKLVDYSSTHQTILPL